MGERHTLPVHTTSIEAIEIGSLPASGGLLEDGIVAA
jgi:hypothetical protein